MKMQPSLKHLVSLLTILSLLANAHSDLNAEGITLDKIKLKLSDPLSKLSDWNSGDATPCSWFGITCDRTSSVTSLDLSNSNLSGPFPPSLSHLHKLEYLNLANNSFFGEVPDTIGELTALTYFDVSNNNLSGRIPATLPNLTFDRLNCSFNNFYGRIPARFAKAIYRSSFLGNPALRLKVFNYLRMWRVIGIVFGSTQPIIWVGGYWYCICYKPTKAKREEREANGLRQLIKHV